MKFLKYIIIGVIIIDCLHANLKVSPTKVFLEYPKRSTTLEIINTQDIELDVWIEYKYGYVATDDSNNYIVISPEKLNIDDRNAAEWITVYPEKFVLGPYEKRNVRLIVNPPTDLQDGEYWSRILINNKKIGKVYDIRKNVNGATIGLEVQHQQSLPFHFRKGKLSTDISFNTEPRIDIKNKKLHYNLNISRIGNTSYWGIVNFLITDKANKVIKREWQPLVVYKQVNKDFIIDLSNVYPGDYNIHINIESKRYDEVAKYVIKTEPKSWKYSFRIQ